MFSSCDCAPFVSHLASAGLKIFIFHLNFGLHSTGTNLDKYQRRISVFLTPGSYYHSCLRHFNYYRACCFAIKQYSELEILLRQLKYY